MASALVEISIADFVARLEPRKRRLPLEGVLETTYRCNLNCVHCYVNRPAGDAQERAAEVSTARLIELVDEIADAGCLYLLLTGGEVLVRPDFERIYLHCLGRGLKVTVFTNGTEITERMADLFEANRPHVIEVSLYGMTKETYERVTRVPGSFAKCLAGIRRLHARKLPLRLKTMALAENAHEVEAMRAFAAELEVSFKHDSLVNARVDCGASRPQAHQLDAAQTVALDRSDPAAFARFTAHAEKSVGPRQDYGPDQPLYTCGAGVTGFTVDPHGQLQLCQLSRRHGFDLREGRFADGWNGLFPRLRERVWQSDGACRRCSLISLCGSCPGAADLEHGDPEAVVASFCEITHARAFAALENVLGHVPDGTCCLGRPGPKTAPASGGGCGSCGHAAPEGQALVRELRVVRAR